jgi:hypothetical protein
MYPPFISPPLPLEAIVFDPPVEQACLESLSLSHILCLAHKSKPGNWTRGVLLPGSPWADDHGSFVVRSRAGRRRPGTTSHAGKLAWGSVCKPPALRLAAEDDDGIGGGPWSCGASPGESPKDEGFSECKGAIPPESSAHQEAILSIRRTTAPISSGTKERLTQHQAQRSGSRDWSRYSRGWMFAAPHVTVPQEPPRPLDNGRPQGAALASGIGS